MFIIYRLLYKIFPFYFILTDISCNLFLLKKIYNCNQNMDFKSNIIQILKRLEIPGNAAKIYIYLLKNGEQNGLSLIHI